MKSLKIPFRIDGGSVGSTDDLPEIMEQKIINVLVTSKLERLGLPIYGVGIQELVFEDIDELVELDFKTDTISEILENVTGLDVMDVRVRQEDTTAKVTVYYRLPLEASRSVSVTASAGFLNEESPL
jgi:phage baseplate assembly protein W